jgi:hypothetical protein
MHIPSIIIAKKAWDFEANGVEFESCLLHHLGKVTSLFIWQKELSTLRIQ